MFISFIVIGKNEGNKLVNCFESIINLRDKFNFINSEIIYVDSNSSDNSIKLALSYRIIKVILLTGDVNAAIARNVGVKHSIGEILVFLDGDMVIQKGFMDLIINENAELIYPFVTGDIQNIYYDSEFNYINEGFYYKKKLEKDEFLAYTGGFFCIKRDYWLLINGMREKYRRSQDLDFCFRLNNGKKIILRKKELAIKHHMISYFEEKRMKLIIKNNDFGYRAMLYREHLFNLSIYPMLFRTDYSFIFLSIIVFLSFLLGNIYLFAFYIGLIIIRSYLQSKNDKTLLLQKIFFFLFRDCQMLISIIFFFPSKHKNYSHKLIN